MMLEATQRVREGLAELVRLVNSGCDSTVDARWVLSESKSFAAQVAVLQADAAALVAAGECHGDEPGTKRSARHSLREQAPTRTAQSMVTPCEQADAPSTSYAADPLFAIA